mgnify:CR=1 FL=1
MSTGTEATRQAMMTVDSDCLATNTHVRSDYRCSETKTGSDTDSSVVQLLLPMLDDVKFSSQLP